MADINRGHKRKRSIEDTPFDRSKLALARKYLTELQEQLQDVEETEIEMGEVMDHVAALEGILSKAKKPVYL
jgi:hypothetical protein